MHRAIRKGNLEAVELLLKAGADPTLETGHEDNVYGNALELIQNPQWDMRDLSKSRLDAMEVMVKTSMEFWDKSTYSGARADYPRKLDNKCKDLKKLRKALNPDDDSDENEEDNENSNKENLPDIERATKDITQQFSEIPSNLTANE